MNDRDTRRIEAAKKALITSELFKLAERPLPVPLDQFRKIIARGGDIHAKSPIDDATLLHLAAGKKQTEFLAFLLDEGLDVNARNSRGETPLHRAAHLPYPNHYQMLLDHGAKRRLKNFEGNTPFMEAAAFMNHEIMEIELNREPKPNVNLRNKDGNTALHLACEGLDEKGVAMLLAAGARHDIANKDSIQPLGVLLDRGNLHCPELLLSAGASPHYRDKTTQSYLWHSINNSFPEITLLLLEHGADTEAPCFIDNPTNDGNFTSAPTALSVALLMHLMSNWVSGDVYRAQIEHLLTHGAVIHPAMLRDEAMHTEEYRCITRYYNQIVPIMNELTRNGVDITSLQPDDLIVAANLGRLDELMHPSLWRGHEAAQAALIAKLPLPIQGRIAALFPTHSFSADTPTSIIEGWSATSFPLLHNVSMERS